MVFNLIFIDNLKHKAMKKIFLFILLIPLGLSSQVRYSVDYNKMIDYNGKSRVEHDYKGTWYFSSDTLLVQKYDLDSLVYNVTEFKGRHVYYRNDFDEVIEVLFMNDMVSVRSNLRTDQYLIFKKK
jgi:hypothetical protein